MVKLEEMVNMDNVECIRIRYIDYHYEEDVIDINSGNQFLYGCLVVPSVTLRGIERPLGQRYITVYIEVNNIEA